MKLTYPHLGDAHIMGRLYFNEIGVETVMPAPNTQKGLELGASLAPEEMCLPFKLMIANLISAWEKGADTVVMPATMGPCRLGVYSDLMKQILDEQGCAYRWILLDSLSAIGPGELFYRANLLVENSTKGLGQIFRNIYRIYKLLKKFEHMESRARITSGAEKSPGGAKRIVSRCRQELSTAGSIKEAFEIVNRAYRKLDEIEVDSRKNPVKILLTGEIYSTIEPFGNHNIEHMLMDMGVSFEKPVSLGWWIDSNIKNPFAMLKMEKRDNPYMPHCIGGYAKNTVLDGLRCMNGEFDGVIQVLPAGCMPEIVAKAIFDDLSGQGKMSVLTVIFDEMAGEAGYITRVEAFIDMLERRKMLDVRKRIGGKEVS